MAKNAEQLTIKIDADASKASQSLNQLIKEIQGVSQALRGFDASKMLGQLKELNKVSKNMNTANLSRHMNALASATAKYNASVSRSASSNKSFGSSFKGFESAISGTSSMLGKVNSKINSFIFHSNKAEKATKNFAQTVGLLYARFFLLIRGVKGLTNMVKSSMDYIEVMNYFDASFGQVAKNSVGEWEKAGYDSAQAYYDSFKERAKKVTGDMSGFLPNSKGLLDRTGMKSLGMNPQELIQYQTQFAQMSNSMGATGEQALYLSEVLTKIGADLASVKNMDFKSVWGDMASGLVGMSRTLDKYGVNIRNSNMEMKLHELGINATVASLSQADKALLRTIILLDSSKYAWGDLAKTINTPANQFRMLANNIKLLGQMIGQILLPVVAKILPYLNAFVIALQRLFLWLAKVLHIDLSGLMSDNSGQDNSDISDMLDDAEGLGDALDKDTDSAKKLKRQLQGFDALNNLTSKDDDDSKADLGALASSLLNDAFLKAVNDYLKAWQDAFDKLKNDAEKIADKIQAFFLRLTKPIRDAWGKVGKFVTDSWQRAFWSIIALAKTVAKDFWKVWEQEETTEIFENIFVVIGDIGLVIRNLVKRFREAWMTNNTGYKILVAIRDIVLDITRALRRMADATVEWAKNIDFKPLLTGFQRFVESMRPVVQNILGIIEDFYTEVMLPLGKWVLEKGLPDLLQVFIDFNKKVNWTRIRRMLKLVWESLLPFAKRVGEGLILFIRRVTDGIAKFTNGANFTNLILDIKEFLDGISAEDVANFIEKVIKAIIGLKIALMALTAIKGLIEVAKVIKTVFSAFWTLGKGIKFATSKVIKFAKYLPVLAKEVQGTMMALGGSGATGLAGFWKFLNMDVGALVSSGSIATAGTTIGTALIGGIVASIVGFNFGKWLGKTIFPKDASFYENFKWFGEGGFFDSVGYVFDSVKEKIDGFVESINLFILKTTLSLAQWSSDTKGTIMQWGIETLFSLSSWASNAKTTIGFSIDIIKAMFKDKFEDIKNTVITKKDEMLEGIRNFFDQSNWSPKLEGIRALFVNTFLGIKNVVLGVFNGLKQTVQNFFNGISNLVQQATTKLNNLKSKMNSSGVGRLASGVLGIGFAGSRFANGGFPEKGQMFIANEAGAEMVGSMGNKTTVANNDQIVAGIASGVYSANAEQNELLRQQNSLLQAILEKDTGISESSVFKAVQNQASSYFKMTGRKAFT